eukprot:4550383-Ditylum_brightwellii.AAC.1
MTGVKSRQVHAQDAANQQAKSASLSLNKFHMDDDSDDMLDDDQTENIMSDDVDENEQDQIDTHEVKREFKAVIKKWWKLKADWKHLFPKKNFKTRLNAST